MLKRITERDESSDIQREAVETMGEIETERALALITELANSLRSTEVRGEAIETLGEHAPLDQLIRVLVRIIEEDRSVEVKRQAVETLAHHDDLKVVELLARIAERGTTLLESIVPGDNTTDLKIEALETLSEMKGGASLNVILETARAHPNRKVRKKAIELLGESKDPRARTILERILTRP